jgi:hypothetical protein
MNFRAFLVICFKAECYPHGPPSGISTDALAAEFYGWLAGKITRSARFLRLATFAVEEGQRAAAADPALCSVALPIGDSCRLHWTRRGEPLALSGEEN